MVSDKMSESATSCLTVFRHADKRRLCILNLAEMNALAGRHISPLLRTLWRSVLCMGSSDDRQQGGFRAAVILFEI
jgi:hypothetical protein